MEGGRKENVTARNLGSKPQNPTRAHLSRKGSGGSLTVSEKRKTRLRKEEGTKCAGSCEPEQAHTGHRSLVKDSRHCWAVCRACSASWHLVFAWGRRLSQLPPAEITPNHPGQESLTDRAQRVSRLAARGEEREEEGRYTRRFCLSSHPPPFLSHPHDLP